MHKENKLRSLKLTSIGLTLFVLAGCNAVITEKSGKDGKEEKNVQISTPLGELKVRKDIDLKELGLTPYPAARLVPNEKGSDDSANVNISTPFFALKVTAANYESSDAPGKITDFYKKDMARYGKVISCKGSQGGNNVQTKGDEMNLKLDCNNVSGDTQGTTLKAGEGSSQHIVVVEPADKSTKIGLVHIRLRGGETETM